MLRRLFTWGKQEGESTCRTSSSSIVSSNEDLMINGLSSLTVKMTSSTSIVLSNEYLMINILSRLPVKTLSRFKCVSKQWNMLISDPYFVSSHQARGTQDPSIIKVLWVDNRNGSIGLCSIKEKEEGVTVDLIHPNYADAFFLRHDILMKGNPCNGLICLTSSDGQTVVCNPTTRNTMVIPRGNNKRDYNYIEGLGYCPSSNEFKVVRLFERSEIDTSIPCHGRFYGCELFTIGQRGTRQHSSSWRQVGNLPHRVAGRSSKTMCYVNGAVHWMIDPLEQVKSSSSVFILSLDLELEEFKVVAHPESWAHEKEYKEPMNMCQKQLGGDERYDLRTMYLKELGGKLCAVCNVFYCDQWDIWVLKDSSNSIWSKDYHIDLSSPYYPYIHSFSAVALWRGIILIDITYDRMLCCYDPITDCCEEVIRLEKFNAFGKFGTYVESLIPPF